MFDIVSIFASIDWAAILKIIGIDIMLGADNAIVIALACAGLPIALRGKAIWMGTAGAVLMRAGLLVIAGFLMGIPYVKFIAGAYLLYIGYSLLSNSDEGDHDIKHTTTVWGAMQTIIVADFMMSLDNVMAVAGAAQSAGEHSNIYAIAGIVFSIPIIIAGASVIMKLMDRFPIIIWVGAGLLGWVGAEMIISDPVLHDYISKEKWVHVAIQVAGFASVILAVLAKNKFDKQDDEGVAA